MFKTLQLKKVLMLMNNIILAIDGCDTLRPFNIFTNSARDTNTINGVELSFNSPKFSFFFLVKSWSLCLQYFPCSISFLCMHGVSVEVWTKKILMFGSLWMKMWPFWCASEVLYKGEFLQLYYWRSTLLSPNMKIPSLANYIDGCPFFWFYKVTSILSK